MNENGHIDLKNRAKFLGFASVSNPSDPTETKEANKDDINLTQWAPFFLDSRNIYINDLALRAQRSPTHNAILQSKVTYAYGQGITDTPKMVNSIGDDWNKIFKKVMRDFVYFGNAWMEGVREGGRLFFFHVDATKCRVSLDGKMGYISSSWRKIGSSINAGKYKVVDVPIFDKAKTQKRFLVHLRSYHPEYEFYGLPDHVGVLRWADIEYQIPTFNIGRFKRGFMGSKQITIKGEPPDGVSAEAYLKEFLDNFTGEGNDHKVILSLVSGDDADVVVTDLDNLAEGEFMNLQQLAQNNIISGHSWFASLAGITTPGALGDRGSLQVQYEAAMNGVAIPRYRIPVLEFLGAAMDETELEVANIQPVSVASALDPKSVISIGRQQEILGEARDERIEGMYLFEKQSKENSNANLTD